MTKAILVLLSSVALLAPGCGEKSDAEASPQEGYCVGTVGDEVCEDDAGCAVGYRCNGGVCSVPCTSSAQCGGSRCHGVNNGGNNDDVDTDGDGLSDGQEAELGTDPTQPDSDSDGYTDFEEVDAGTDPLDAEDRIYKGGWPYNPNKDEIEDPGFGSTAGLGTMLPRYKAVDQYGDEVDIYDFFGQGKPVVLDIATWFCEPCKSLAEFLSTGDASVMDQWGWWNPDFAVVREMIENREVYWITILYSKGTPVVHEDVALWDETWPNENIVILADTDLVLQEHMEIEAIPRIDTLDENLVFISYDDGPHHGMRFLLDLE
jgi:thiol-disulfide isomerase/thioredoxin